jgi:hypothetical protein
MFGMLWVNMYLQQLHTAIEEEWDNIPQATINKQPDQLYMKEMCRTACRKWWEHQILTGFLIHVPIFFYGVCDQQMHVCIPVMLNP